MTSLQRLFKKDQPTVPAYDSGNGSVSSTSSLSSVDSQSNLSQERIISSNNVPNSNNSTKSQNKNESSTVDAKDSPASHGINTEEEMLESNKDILMNDKQIINPGKTKHPEIVTNAQESRNPALNNVNHEQEKTDVNKSWRTRLKPGITIDKPLSSDLLDPKPVNKVIGKFETPGNDCGNDSRSTVKIELTNKTPVRYESTNQIKVKLKSSNEKQTAAVENVETASSCENHARNELHHKGHNDNRAPELPQFVKEMIDSKAFPGDSVRFDVEYIGNPQPEVVWYFEEDVISESPRHIIQCTDSGTCSLIVKNVNEDDDGEYFCKIVNSSGEEMCSAELIVYGAI